PYSARTTSQFLEAFNLQLAINGDSFRPWRDNGLFNFYPHSGDGVDTKGLAASQGEIVTSGVEVPRSDNILYISETNHVSFREPEGVIYNAITGLWMIVVDGVIQRPSARRS